jgi:hypothetical protein
MIKNKSEGVTMKHIVTYQGMLLITSIMLFLYLVPADDNHLVAQAEAQAVNDSILSLPCNDTSVFFLHCLSALLDINCLGYDLHKLIDDLNMPDSQNEFCTAAYLAHRFQWHKMLEAIFKKRPSMYFISHTNAIC